MQQRRGIGRTRLTATSVPLASYARAARGAATASKRTASAPAAARPRWDAMVRASALITH